ncbi:MAG TPA: hypothetical protein VKB80_36590 [Kofleriaceae bacterium]|nr:hypothetical protein [Kofleriaceae bacterium]
MSGCASPDVGSEAFAAKHCPDGVCDPPDDPPDDPPEDPPEPPPPQPDPAKRRDKLIPIDFVATRLDDFLTGTTVHVSQTAGDTLSIPFVDQVCHTDPEVAECRARCHEGDLTPRQLQECLADCGDANQTCEDVCSSFEARSFLKWGNNAIAASVRDDPSLCNASTCPACDPPRQVASLENESFGVPLFERDYTVGPFSYHFSCRVNNWRFSVGGNIALEASPAGLTATLPGVTDDPAIPCVDAPDVEVDGLELQIKFVFPTSGLDIAAEGDLLGDWHILGPVLDAATDMNSLVSTAVRDGSHDALNTIDARDAYARLFRGLVGQYVEEVTHEQLDILGNVQATTGGLNVRYWVK